MKDLIAQRLNISDEELSAQIASGTPRFSKNIDWARFYLAKAGYIDASTRGVWSLTEEGRKVKLSSDDALRLFKEIHCQFSDNRYKTKEKVVSSEEDALLLDEPKEKGVIIGLP